MPTAVEVERLGKRYRLGTDGRYDTLREALERTVRRRSRDTGELWALREVSFAVERGEALGVIGANGAGKTTLLKILAGIAEPTEGEARTRGRVGSLLDVGTGFHPELTGRENVYLDAAILGMRRAEVNRQFDAIVEFAGVERFLDTPVKRYSDGMKLRLAFAIAAHIEPPILVVDEVLAVGDAAFREKCLGKMAEVGAHERTVLFVSHDLGAVTRLCPQAIWLDNGRLREHGPAREVASTYLQTRADQPLVAEFDRVDDDAVALAAVRVRSPEGTVLTAVRRDRPFVVESRVVVRESVPALDIAVALINEQGVRVLDDARSDWPHGEDFGEEPDAYEVAVVVPPLLAPGRYALQLWIGNDYEDFVLREVLNIRVMPLEDDVQHVIERRRVVQPRLEWKTRREALGGTGQP